MAGDDRDPAGADRVTALERRSHRLLRAYPAVYRRERGEEIISTLLDATPAERTWPRPRDARALIVGGLKARAAQNRHLTTADNLRIAVLVGVAIYLCSWVGTYLASAGGGLLRPSVWSGWLAALAVLTGLLVAASVLAAWAARRMVTITIAVLASTAVASFAEARHVFLIGPTVTQVLCLAALAVLAPRAARPARRWLWLLGVFVALAALSSPSVNVWLGPVGPGVLLLGVGAVSILWAVIDARLIVAITTYLTLTVVQSDLFKVTQGFGVYSQIPPLLIVAAVAALAVWLLRRQSAGGVT
jgi:hypothetical protein